MKIVIAETKKAKCSYLQLLKLNAKTASLVGPATVFLSHAWKYNFLMVLQVILDWCSKNDVDKKTCFVWFDIFTVNQHTGITDFVYWSEGFEKSILTIGKVIIVLFPWDNPVWLGRAWCLYEFWAVLNGKVPHEFLLPTHDQPKFLDYLVRGGRFEDVVKYVDISRAESGDKEAERRIKETVAARVGFAALNEAVTGGLRAWFLSVSADALAALGPDPSRLTGDLQLTVANMRMGMGRPEEAAAMLKERLAAQRAAPAPAADGDPAPPPAAGDAGIATTLWHLGTAHSLLGRPEEALAAFDEALALQTAALGERHPLTATTMMSQGVVLYEQGRLDAAVTRLTAALAIQRETLGESHAQTAATLLNLGSAYLK
jgi:hypothetical protein